MAIGPTKELWQKIDRVERLLRCTTDEPILKVLIGRLEELRAKLKSSEMPN
jgi:hypothetical protein